MTTPIRKNRRWPRVLAAAALLAALTGCFNPFSPRIAPVRGTSSPPPVPNSAAQVVELFAWCWNNRAYQEYTEIFTEDFRFQLSARDTAGQGGRGDFLTRDEELETALHLFVEGNASEPPARSITLDITRPLIESPDGRDGVNGISKPEPWHKEVSTDVNLRIDTGEQDFQVVGRARFFLVRGDSANIPDDLIGFHRDSTRWWIERWEDETDGGPSGAAAVAESRSGRAPAPLSRSRVTSAGAAPPAAAQGSLPEILVSWARLKIAYLGRQPVASRARAPAP